MKAGKNSLLDTVTVTITETEISEVNREAENLLDANALKIWQSAGAALSGEVLYYDFSDSADMGADSSGEGNDGAATDVTQVNGPFGKAGSFNGTTSWIEMSNPFTVDYTGSWSCSGIFNTSSLVLGAYFAINTFTGLNNVVIVILEDGRIQTIDRNGGIQQNITSTESFNDGNDHFIYFEFDTVTNKFDCKIDGVSLTNYPFSSAGGSIATVHTFSLGQEYDEAARSDFFDGTISDFRFFNRVLTDAERTNLYLYNAGLTANVLATFTTAIEPDAVALFGLEFSGSITIDTYETYPGAVTDTITIASADLRGFASKNIFLELDVNTIEAIKITAIFADSSFISAGYLWAGELIDFECAEEIQPADISNDSATITRGNTVDVNTSYEYITYDITLKKDNGFEALREKIRALLVEGFAIPRPYIIDEPILTEAEVLLGMLDAGKVGYDLFPADKNSEEYIAQCTIGIRETRGRSTNGD